MQVRGLVIDGSVENTGHSGTVPATVVGRSVQSASTAKEQQALVHRVLDVEDVVAPTMHEVVSAVDHSNHEAMLSSCGCWLLLPQILLFGRLVVWRCITVSCPPGHGSFNHRVMEEVWFRWSVGLSEVAESGREVRKRQGETRFVS